MTSEKMPRPLSVAKGEPTATVVSTPDASNKSDTAHKTTLTQSAKPILMADTSIATTKDNDSVAQPRVSMNVEEFQGEVQTTNELPTIETLRKIEAYNVLDSDGKSHSFKSLYAGRNSARRVLIIFIRHFFCGNCQEYLRTLSASVTPEALLQLPVSTFIAVIGCGSPHLINSYIQETGCPFPVYADPTRRLYTELGMVRTLAMGSRPAYMQGKTLAHTVVSGVVQGLKQVKSGLVTKMGDQKQVGGEFLFEPATLTLDTPVTTPRSEEDKQLRLSDENEKSDDYEDPKVEEKRVTWCHRMRTTRDHAEIPELMEVLGLDGTGAPIKDKKRWDKALRTRKGTGLSMASQMSRLSVDTTRTNNNGSIKANEPPS
ncbi:AhpC/TSA antioxidant enzyme-domain-containing protein [Daldinia loculata]|uniref:AhpC/TSA antioxidant enzyme-domain-containing protein n=1 Tax=Daldinia loculata TaxID=103429 RepID=UPI0020C58FD2|nr:AhpC/TSA antioxidant enzyme-domain-containing protein [Daldinia loculata]KAI1650192.1 AhpC/TSA antioxidant enzyme-domain-containing protein [Daldinia loculata]KAI2776868.1 AhpC/TSA antioxidant enzyme-domain-containing protein [Daldinia loculata]